MKDNKVSIFLSLLLSLVFILVLTSCVSQTTDTQETTGTTAAATTAIMEETTAITTTTAPEDIAVLDPELTGKWVEENSTISMTSA